MGESPEHGGVSRGGRGEGGGGGGGDGDGVAGVDESEEKG